MDKEQKLQVIIKEIIENSPELGNVDEELVKQIFDNFPRYTKNWDRKTRYFS